MSTYGDFIESKMQVDVPRCEREAVCPAWDLFPWQKLLVERALTRGRSAMFADTGTGKTRMELAWATAIGEITAKPTLLLAPLAVSKQIVREARDVGAEAVYSAGDGTDAGASILVSNYERLHYFDPSDFGAVVLDESSILKSFDGTTRKALTEFASTLAYRLCATATPAPNDYLELGQHSEFLSVLSAKEMMALYFTQDGNSTTKWRMKHYAEADFWRWVASWATAMRKPSDVGFPEGDVLYDLPPLTVHSVEVEAANDHAMGTLFRDEARTLSERRRARRETMTERVAATIRLVQADTMLRNGHQQGEERVQPGVARTEPRARQDVPRGDQGAPKRSPTRTVRAGPGDSRQGQKGSREVLAGEPRQTKGAETQDLRADAGGVSADAGGSKRGVRDLRAQRSGQPKSLSPRGPQSRDGGDSGSAMHELQPGSGQVPGRPVETLASQALSRRFPITGGERWIIWCDLNDEQRALEQAFGAECLSVYGTLPSDEKERRILAWLDGDAPVILSKPQICGHGLNLQACSRMVFVGLSDSFERYFQAVRRCWRFGQRKPVHAYVVTADVEGAVVRNIENKQRRAERMAEELLEAMTDRTLEHLAKGVYESDDAEGDGWKLLLGDCVERLPEVEDDSVGLTVFSPPFPSMYVYTDQARDMGNVKSVEQMIEHFGYLVPGLLRVTMPGRSVAIHLAQAQTRKRDGQEIGLRDFRGATIQAMEAGGFTYYGEVCIDKDPQAKAIRTKDRGLLFKTLAKDSANMRMAQADYLLQFRKPGENPQPIAAGISERYDNEDGWITPEEWIEWAAPVWYRAGEGYPGGIRETDVLNVSAARDKRDERHLATLQRGVIERAIKLWSAPGDLILSPFAGVGSEGVVAISLGRRYIGIELKKSYWETACRNISETAVGSAAQLTLPAA